jgi:hypothetical protein
MSSMTGGLNRFARAEDVLTKRRLIVAIAHTALALLLALAVTLLIRRFSGNFHRPLRAAAIVLAAAFLELATLGIRQLFRNPDLRDSLLSTEYLVLSTQYFARVVNGGKSFPPKPTRFRLSPIDFLTTAAPLLILAALSMPGTSPVGLLTAWLVIISGETAQRLPRFRSRLADFSAQQPSPGQMPAGCVLPTDEIMEPEIPPGLVQQVTRVVEGGRESIHGLLKAEVAANDRLAIVHIAFCPPLAERPELSAHALDCDDAEIRLTQVESFGARLEARLPAILDTPRSVIIEILGSAKASQCS